ncbi:hypothetical protein ACFFX0_00730 [Citricoccus parietis]|uniref:Uncharacterized protein n=1 Tax=Citricoccus parietis TaxID=592307 RepID=A0ABV5FSZ6_9MICC
MPGGGQDARGEQGALHALGALEFGGIGHGDDRLGVRAAVVGAPGLHQGLQQPA